MILSLVFIGIAEWIAFKYVHVPDRSGFYSVPIREHGIISRIVLIIGIALLILFLFLIQYFVKNNVK